MHRILLIAASSLAFAAFPAQAQTTIDVRCLVVSNVFAKASKQEKARKLAEAATYFYLGRVGDRFADARMKASIDAQTKSLKGAKLGPIMAACAQTMKGAADRLQALSRR